jgi:phosphomannomutase
MSEPKINPSIFKAYDIRGVYGDDLNEEIAYRVGRAFSEILIRENSGKKLQVVVGGDMRVSTPSLKKEVIRGITDSGINVVDVGLVTTPTFYFSVAYYGFDGGLQVSASHNPKEYNGFKMVRAHGVPFSGDSGIYEIRDMVIANEFSDSTEKGKVSTKEGVVEEETKVQQKDLDVSGIKPFKIVVDAANAMGAVDVEAMFSSLNCELIKLNFELDGTFPVHQPDPLDEENLKIVKDAVLEHKADLGISPDGDGDRYFFIDEKGEVVRQEILRGILAQIELKDNPGATVCYDIRPGRITRDMIEEAGGRAVVTKVGHSLIKETMIKEGAIFGGESSGHFFYKTDYGTFETPIIFVTKLLKFISEQGKPVSEIIAPYRKYHHSGEINSDVEDKEGKMKAIAEKYSDAEISWLDGVTVEYPDFWFNVRASNTEPLLRLNLEAVSEETMKEKRDEVLEFIRN